MKENTYYVVMSFMVDDLHLKGIELQLYAIIHGFSQDGENAFRGSIAYLQDWTGVARSTVFNGLASLVEKGLLEKKDIFMGNVKFCEYKTTSKKIIPPVRKQDGGSTEIRRGVVKKQDGGSTKIRPNNIENNKDDIKEDSVPPTPCEEDVDLIVEMLADRNSKEFAKFRELIKWALGQIDYQPLFVFVSDYAIMGGKGYEAFKETLLNLLGEQK